MLESSASQEILARWGLASRMDVVFDLEKSNGAYLHDAKRGRDYLDFFGFHGARALGFDHEAFKDASFLAGLTRAARNKPSSSDLCPAEYADFLQRFAEGPLGGHFAHVVFAEGGALGVEGALKAAFDWKHRKNIAANVGEKGSKVVHFRQAYHGRSGYALSASDSPDPRKTLYFPRFDWPRVLNPKMRFPLDEAAQTEVEEREKQSLAEIQLAFDRDSADIAAVLIEPIQGEGGDNYFRTEFLRELRTLCDERDALLIFDETRTGFGATGSWWDWQHHEIKPDLLCFGAKAQVCGFASTDRVDEVESVFRVPSRLSTAFDGHLPDMVRCARIIEVIEEDDLISNAQVMGSYLLRILEELGSSHDEIENVRGRGLWCAFDLPSTEERDRMVAMCFEEELLVLPTGTQTIAFRPSLDIDADAIARAIAQAESALQRTYGRK